MPQREYFTATLLRAGVADRLELRLSTPGIVVQDLADETATGFGPLTVGMKIHLWDPGDGPWLPAAGAIIQVTAPIGSSHLRPKIWEPAFFLNFDHLLPWHCEFEWNWGLAWVQPQPSREPILQTWFLWAFSRTIQEDWVVFAHGFTVLPLSSGDDTELVLGPGLLWFVNDHAALDASLNFGLTGASPQHSIRIGLSLAY